MSTAVPGLQDRIRQVVGDKPIDGIPANRLSALLSGWQLPTSLELALIGQAVGVTVLWLLHGHDDEADDQPVPTAGNLPGTLGELRARLRALEHLPDDTLVVLAASPEGVHYSPVQVVEEGLYEGDDNVGQFYLPEDLREHIDDPSEFPPAPPGARPAVVLYPRS